MEMLCLYLWQFVKGDITSPDLVNYLLTSEGIDTIMHFAAQVCSIRISYRKIYAVEFMQRSFPQAF